MLYAWLGEQPYLPFLARMQQQAALLQRGEGKEAIWCCHHPPVYTTGRRGVDNRVRPALPAPLVATDRGGETTFHGPGQLMLYPILKLRPRHLQPRAFVHLLEESCITLLRRYGITAVRKTGAPGVWSDRGKIAAIGLRIGGGVSWHGMALNVTTDLDWFDAIRPCGLPFSADNMANHIAPPALETLAEAWSVIFRKMVPGEPSPAESG